MKSIQSVKDSLLKIEKAVLVLLLSVMVAMSFTQVVLRQVFSTGILWADVFLRYLVLWAGFFGAAVATAQHRHFSIDLVKKFLPGKTRRSVEIVSDLFALVCLAFLSAAAVRFFQTEAAFPSILFTVGNLEVPAHWLEWMVPAGFILLGVHFLLNLLESILNFRREEDVP